MNNFFKENWVKIIIAILLFWALADNPYSYYQFLRWVVLIAGAYMAYDFYQKQKIGWAWIFGIMAVLFNPIIPFYLSKDTWQLIDVISAIIFFVSLFVRHDEQN